MIRVIKTGAKSHHRVSELIPPTIEVYYLKSDTVEIDIDKSYKRWSDYFGDMSFGQYLESVYFESESETK